jgi:hypothetical protein
MAPISQLQQRWEELRVSKVQAFWLCAAGVIATLVIGFGVAGWVTGGRAEAMAQEAANNARMELAVAVCVDDFVHAKDAGARLAKLKSAEFYERGDVIATAGYATMPDRQEADSALAMRCAAALEEARLPGAKAAKTKS